jgi:hypothetical protein
MIPVNYIKLVKSVIKPKGTKHLYTYFCGELGSLVFQTQITPLFETGFSSDICYTERKAHDQI